jgi:hypothetical protein
MKMSEALYQALAAADPHATHTIATDEVCPYMEIVTASTSLVIRATYDPVATQRRAKAARLNKSIAAGYVLPQISTR